MYITGVDVRPYSAEVTKVLVSAGIALNISGFGVLGAAVALTADGGFNRKKVVSDLYPEIAKMFGTTPTGVERNIRTAINKAWASGGLQRFYEREGIYAEKCPSNSVCIAQLAYVYKNMQASSTRQEEAK